MKKSNMIVILCFVFLYANILKSQEKPALVIQDSVKFNIELNKKISGNFSANVIDPQRFVYQEKDFLKLRAKLYIPSFEDTQKPLVTLTPQDILSPLYSQYMEAQKHQTWQYILGTIQAGAVGYLAYKHIQKYGFK
ncbi:MAG: hypothetical protein V1773_17775 [bacterium]